MEDCIDRLVIICALRASAAFFLVLAAFLSCSSNCCNGMEGDVVKLNRTATLTGCASLVLGSFLLAPMAHAAQQGCSVEKLQGRYVFTGQGSNLHYGAFDFDGTGKFSGKQTSLRYKTSLQREALSGTYNLDADCTGTMTLEGQLGGTAHWDVFVTNDGKKGRMIRTDSGTRASAPSNNNAGSTANAPRAGFRSGKAGKEFERTSLDQQQRAADHDTCRSTIVASL
jgi:hypothetical protein